MTKYNIKCKCCGKIFQSTSLVKRYCSEECNRKVRIEACREYTQTHRKTCTLCGLQYYITKFHRNEQVCPSCVKMIQSAAEADRQEAELELAELKLKEKKRRRKPRVQVQLGILSAMAKEHHVSYGVMAAMVDRGEIEMWSEAEWNRYRKEHKK